MNALKVENRQLKEDELQQAEIVQTKQKLAWMQGQNVQEAHATQWELVSNQGGLNGAMSK